jgi:hypothetical protein
MTLASFVECRRADLDVDQRSELLGKPTLAERHSLLQNDYVWLERAGVAWTHPDARLRRGRFTHDAGFEARHGAFRSDSAGNVHETGNRAGLPPVRGGGDLA